MWQIMSGNLKLFIFPLTIGVHPLHLNMYYI